MPTTVGGADHCNLMWYAMAHASLQCSGQTQQIISALNPYHVFKRMGESPTSPPSGMVRSML